MNNKKANIDCIAASPESMSDFEAFSKLARTTDSGEYSCGE
jgi:hypothetical protein